MMIVKFVFKAAFMIFFINTVSAEEKHCSLIEDHNNRHNCYAKNTTPNNKKWLLAKSKFNNSTSITRSALYPVMCGDNVGSNSIILTCIDAKTELVLSTSCVMGNSNENSIVMIQIDDQEQKSVSFTIPNNKYALKLPDGNSAIELTKSALGYKLLHIRVSPPSVKPYTATFDISDLQSNVAPLREACNW